MSGRLFVVATPIGNLEDITLRALRVLKECDLILAEDTRRTRTLCTHFAIGTRVQAFHAHSGDAAVEKIITLLQEGKKIALVTDAGTPLVSDPGANLVAEAHDHQIHVEPIPGASAVLSALASCGLRVDSFRFIGFIPRSGSKRRHALEQVKASTEASVVFESPNRIAELLTDLAEATGEARRVAVCRELTKVHEEIVRGTAGALAEAWRGREGLGEFTVVIEGRDPKGETAQNEQVSPDELADTLLLSGLSTKDAAKELASATGLSRHDAYTHLLAAQTRRKAAADSDPD